MDAPQREQVRLLLVREADESRRNFEERRESIYSSHAAAGRLQSGATIKLVLRAMEEVASNLLKSSVDEVSRVAKDTEAFSLIREAIHQFDTYLLHEVEGVATMAGGGHQPANRKSSIFREAHKLYSDQQSRLNRQLEIHRFQFIQRAVLPNDPSMAPPAARSRGGRPLARHWDQVWSAIAVQLYLGDLKPTKQADIENAMKDWFASEGLDAGDTPIRDRARVLWRKIEESE